MLAWPHASTFFVTFLQHWLALVRREADRISLIGKCAEMIIHVLSFFGDNEFIRCLEGCLQTRFFDGPRVEYRLVFNQLLTEAKGMPNCQLSVFHLNSAQRIKMA